MPGGDRTGPMGQGSRTGRVFGYCEGFDSPGFTKGARGGMGRGLGHGRGMGMGRARGLGRGRNLGGVYPGSFQGYTWMPAMSKEDEVKLLKSQADALNRSQKNIEKRLGELEDKDAK